MKSKQKKQKQQKQINLQRILLNPVPQQQKPPTFYTIQSPDTFPFPIQSTLIQGIQLLEQYSPSDINKKIEQNVYIQRIAKYKGKLCIQGKNFGFICDGVNMGLQSVSTFTYGPNYLIVAYQNKNLAVFGLDLKLIKQIKNFSEKKITCMKIITTPQQYEGIVLVTSSGYDLTVHKIQKSFFTTLSCKSSIQIKRYKSVIVQLSQMPKNLNNYIARDVSYIQTSLIAVLTHQSIQIIRFNNNKLNSQKFTEIIYSKTKNEKVKTAYSCWSQASIYSRQYQIQGQHLVLSYSFGNKFYLAVLRIVNQFFDTDIKVKYQWLQSKPFIFDDKQIIYCNHIKKHEILFILKPNEVVVFYTKGNDLFVDSQKASDKQLINYSYDQQIKPHKILFDSEVQTYADSFLCQYGTNQIYCIHKYYDSTRQKLGIGVYVYCNWRQICQMLKLNGNYSSSMSFLISIYKGTNKFNLGYKNQDKYKQQLSQYIYSLVLEYMKQKYAKFIQIESQNILTQIQKNYSQTRDILITPIQLLTTTQQFDFLFTKFKDAAIKNYFSKDIFYKLLEPFIRYGRIKYIPKQQLRKALDYYVQNDKLELIQRLAIYFNLQKIDRKMVIQYCLINNLTVSLAYICTQGDNDEFVIPFKKLWELSQHYRHNKQYEYAQLFAIRALWYVKLCLQRGMSLKDYPYQKYGQMIYVLTKEFFKHDLIIGLLRIRPETCLQTLCHYFSIQNGCIVNEFCKIEVGKDINQLQWLQSKPGNEKLEQLLASIYFFIQQTKIQSKDDSQKIEYQQFSFLFLSKIIIYKTIKFTKNKYDQILKFLIKNFTIIKKINYGLQQLPQDYQQTQQMDQIYSSQYINKLLVLIIYQLKSRNQNYRLDEIYQASRFTTLTQLQAQISFLTHNYRNCIDIYLRGRPSSKKRIFKFIQNNLKDLILDKKKKQRKHLQYEVKDRIKQLIALDANKSRNLIQTYLPQSQQQLIQALRNDEDLQLQYLQGVIQSSGKITQNGILKFIELMCKAKPTQLLQVLKKNTKFPVEQSLKICQTYKIYQCMQYLYQRMGNIQQSVKIAALRIQQIFIQKQLDDYDQHELDPYIKISNILTNVIQVCINNHSQSVWESLFDSSVNLFNKFKKNKKFQDEINVLYQINSKILYNLMSYCSIQHSIWLIQTKYNNLDMGGSMKKVFIQILSNFSYNQNILFTAKDLNKYNYSQFQHIHYQKIKKAYAMFNVCFSCYQILQKKQGIICFLCGHVYHKDCVYQMDQVQNLYCITCLKSPRKQFQIYFSSINPQNPKIKVDKVIQEHENLRQMMVTNLKNEQKSYQQKLQNEKLLTQIQQRKRKFEKYEQNKGKLEFNNEKIEKDLIQLSRRMNTKIYQLKQIFPEAPKTKILFTRKNR